MSTPQKIRMECQGAATLPIVALNEMQGELKSLSQIDYERLKAEILDEGFSYSVHVWKDEKQNKHFILDGHQRIRTLKQLIEEGWECGEIPISFVYAVNFEAAKRKLLGGASQYGKVEAQGLYEYLDGMEVDMEYLKSHVNFPAVDLVRFEDEFYKDLHANDHDEEPKTVTVEAEVRTSSTESPKNSGGDNSNFSDGVEFPSGGEEYRAVYLKLPVGIADGFQAQLDRFNRVLFPEEKDLSSVYPGAAVQAMVQHLAQIEDEKLI